MKVGAKAPIRRIPHQRLPKTILIKAQHLFHQSVKAMNLGGMFEGPRGMSTKSAPATQAPSPFQAYTMGNMATNVANPYAPYKVLLDPMMSALNSTIIAYIANMVSREVCLQEKNLRCPLLSLIPTMPILKRSSSPQRNIPDLKMFNGTGNTNQCITYFILGCGRLINGSPTTKDALLLQLFLQSLEGAAFR